MRISELIEELQWELDTNGDGEVSFEEIEVRGLKVDMYGNIDLKREEY